jgi:O-antigen ligase
MRPADLALPGRPAPDAPPGALPRADAPRGEAPAEPGGAFFSFGSASLRGLPLSFWFLQVYLFLGASAIDEEFPSVGRFHPRMIVGVLALCAGVPRALKKLSERRVRTAGRAAGGAARPDELRNRPLGWIVAFLVATGFSTLWAFDPAASQKAGIELATAVLGFLLVVGLVRTRREVLVTVLVMVAGAGFYLLRSFLEYLNGRISFAMGVTRMMGAGQSTADPNSFAATIVYALPLVVWAGVRTRSRFLAFCALAYGLLTPVCVVLTHSRSGLVLFALTAAWTFFALPRGKARFALGLATAVVGITLAAGLTQKAVDRYASMFSETTYEEEGSTRGRIVGYEIAWRIFQEYPVVGIGPGSWGTYRRQRVDGSTLEPHNLAGDLLASTGLLGFGTFLGYLLTSVALGFRVRGRTQGSTDPWDRAVRALAGVVLVSILLHLVSGLAAHNLGRSGWYLLPALLFVAATCRRTPEPEKEPA